MFEFQRIFTAVVVASVVFVLMVAGVVQIAPYVTFQALKIVFVSGGICAALVAGGALGTVAYFAGDDR